MFRRNFFIFPFYLMNFFFSLKNYSKTLSTGFISTFPFIKKTGKELSIIKRVTSANIPFTSCSLRRQNLKLPVSKKKQAEQGSCSILIRINVNICSWINFVLFHFHFCFMLLLLFCCYLKAFHYFFPLTLCTYYYYVYYCCWLAGWKNKVKDFTI